MSDGTASDRGLYSVECCLASDCVCEALGLLPVRLCVCVGGCGMLSDSTASDRGLYSIECCLASDCVCEALGLQPVRLCVCV